MTQLETQALESLRAHVEGSPIVKGGQTWREVYLDNAKPSDWTGATWAGVLGSLAKKGLFKADGDSGFQGAFGRVLSE